MLGAKASPTREIGMRTVLRRGSEGREVEQLQRLLAEKGFRPGRIDGRFGPATEAAVLAFQLANGLLADGVVGPLTWRALDPGVRIERPDATRWVDVELVADMFPFTPLGPIRAHLPLVLDALREFDLTDKPMVLTALATIRAEAEGFEPVDERPSRYNTSPDGRPFDLYDWRADLGNLGPDDGARYRGRGFVQLTGRDNYRRCGAGIGLGDALVFAPERANEPVLAARLLAYFLAERALAIKRALLDGDLLRARRLVNGGRHGYERFEAAWRLGARRIPDPVWPALPFDPARAA